MAVAATPVRPTPALSAARPLRIGANEVHVWQIELEGRRRAAEQLWELLAEREQARARRFRFARDARSYVVMRGTLRTLLARYLGLPAESVRFAVGPRGKPSLAGSEVDVRFNVTDAGSLGLAAFALGRELGVDLEPLGREIDHLALARHFFAPAEAARLESLPEGVRERAFLECWTRKEAYTKALGLGLYLPLDSFEVDFGPGSEPRLVAADDRDADGRRFAIAAPPVARGYVAALVVEKRAPDERLVVASEARGTGEPLVYRAVAGGPARA